MLKIAHIINFGQSCRRSLNYTINFYRRKYLKFVHIKTLISMCFSSHSSTININNNNYREHEAIFNEKYQRLLSESCGIKWFSDGSIDVKRSIYMSMGSYFSISNEMTFMLAFNMLYARDRHQLFELLCLQLSSIILAYSETIKEITKIKTNVENSEGGGEDSYDPLELMKCKKNSQTHHIIIINAYKF